MFDETGANNQDHSATFAVTSSVLDPAKYPMFADSRSVADWLRPGAAPFSPYSGPQYMSAGADSQAYKRLGKTLDLTGATTPKLDFKISADVEEAWDWVVVEARDVTTNPNSDAWTTLAELDTDGAGDADTSLTTTSTGDSCPEGLGSDPDAPHPFLLHYWSLTCEPHGRTGDWNAFTGNTGGWASWTSDLSAFAGKKVDLRISVITDWGTLGLGTWVDDIRVTNGATTLDFTDFESSINGWTIGPPPAGTDIPLNGWTRRTEEFKEGGVVATNDTLFTGFGFEGINESARNEFMKRTLTHLGVLATPPAPTPETARDAGGGPAGRRGRPPATAAQAPSDSRGRETKHASAKIKSSRNLRVDRKGVIRVRVTCQGDAGSACTGTLQAHARQGDLRLQALLHQGGADGDREGPAQQSGAGDAEVSGKAAKATVVVSGKDSAGSKLSVRQAVKLK